MFIKKLCGERCYLSPVDETAAEKVAEWSNDIYTSIRTLDVFDMITLDVQKEYIQSMNDGGYGFYIVDNKTNEAIGIVRLKSVDLINRTAELGAFIGDKNYLGKGYGPEAYRLILNFAFNILNLKNIMGVICSFNEYSIKAAKKLGFKEIGRRRKSITLFNKEYDEVYMELLNSEFKGENLL